MRTLALFGSPRLKGAKGTLLNRVQEFIETKGHSFELINLTKADVKGCVSCYKCKKSLGEPGCSQKDEASETIFNKMMQSDRIIYASPVYCWSWSGQMKPLIDRHYCLVKNDEQGNSKSLLKGKPTGLIMTSGGPYEGNAELAVKQYERLSWYTQTVIAGKLVITDCGSRDQFGPKEYEAADDFAAKIIG